MSEEASSSDVRRAVALAREALEQDAAEARKRGWGIPTPDSSSVAALAAGLLVADAINGTTEARQPADARSASRTRASRTAA
jgi:hypothetical protein